MISRVLSSLDQWSMLQLLYICFYILDFSFGFGLVAVLAHGQQLGGTSHYRSVML